MREVDQELFDAVEQGKLSRVKRCIDRGANIYAIKNYMVQLTGTAVRDFMVDFGIRAAGDVSVTREYSKTPLDVAREKGHKEIVAYLATKMADAFHEKGKYNKAWQAYQEAFDIQKVILGPNHPDTLSTRNNIARAFDNQGKYSEALKIYQAVFDKRKSILGPNHPDTLSTQHSMAGVLDDQGKYSEALKIYQAVFDKRKSILGPNHPDTLSTQHSMARVLENQGKYSEALKIYQAVFDKRKSILGPNHPDTLSTRNNMAVVLENQGEYSGALKIYQEVFEKRKEVLGPDHPDTLMTRNNMAGVLDDQGKYSGALKIYQEVFEKRKEVLGPDHPGTLMTRHNMAGVLSSQGEHNEALKIYQEVFDVQQRREVLGPDHPSTLNTHNNIAVVLKRQGKYSEALEIYRKVFEKRKDVSGPDHPNTLRARHSMAGVFFEQGKYSKALEIYQEVFDVQQRREVLGPDHPDTLRTRHNMAGVFFEQGKYSEALKIYQAVFEKRREVLGPNHPDTLRTRNSMAAVREIIEDQSECSIQFCQEQQKAYFHLSGFISNNLQNASIKPVRQGLYLPSFEARNVKINGKCTAITRWLSQALLSQGGESFLSNLKTSTKIYERIAQGKQVSKREEREVFAFSKLLNKFEGQLDSSTNSLPLNLIHTQSYKTLGDLSNYIARVKSNFAIHLVISNHVVAIYRIGDNYTYFDSNAAFVSGLKSVDQLMQVVEKGVKSAGYKAGEKGFLVEHFDVDKANSQLSNEDKQILAKEIKTERQLLAEQDKEFGFIKVNGQELSRVQLYDFGTKINVEGSVPLLINAEMNLSSKKFQDHLDKKEVSMTAREYLGHLKNSKNVEKVIQATKVIPFEGSSGEIRDAEETRKTCNKPEPYLSGITISNQPVRTRAPGN